ncbi:MAG: T9SS type A sorting domain-containing protein [bacterium]|nr:T9SS type A sorting domain-containing protein [bacterium]
MTKKLLFGLSLMLLTATFVTAQIIPPTNLTAQLDTLTGQVSLAWEHETGGNTQELIYDNGPSTNGYTYVGYTMSSRMSPTSACQVLTLKIYTFWYGQDSLFDAECYNWTGSQPGTTLLHRTRNVVAAQSDWTMIDVSGAGLNVTGDFMVGFASILDSCYMGFDTPNNGRAWDFNRTAQTWATWNETYLIRAIVEYPGGEIAELSPVTVDAPTLTLPTVQGSRMSATHELRPQTDATDVFQYYIMYRNNVDIAHPTALTYVDNLPTYGNFIYWVSAFYDEGQSAHSNSAPVSWTQVGVEPEHTGSLPTEYSMSGAYPNPFNPTTQLSFALPTASSVTLNVYDVNGQLVAELVNGWRSAGQHQVTFDGTNLASGIYLYNLQAGEYTTSGKMVLTK